MVQKRKAVNAIVTSKAAKAATKEAAQEAEEDVETQIVPSEKVMKKPAAAKSKKQEKVEEKEEEENDEEEEDEEEDDEEDEEEEEEEEISPEKALAQQEEQIKVERSKELKSMYMDELKKIAADYGLPSGSKDALMKAVLKHEAKAREETRAHKAKIRGVVVQKKEELEAKSMADLAKMCESIGAKGVRAKPDRVAKLLVHWQEHDGVDKALAQIAVNERKEELSAMDSASLHKLCKKADIDPYVKEVMVDRISKKEQEVGRYSRTTPAKETTKAIQDVDMVDALLANENLRKKEKQQEDALANKKKELRKMEIDELKKALTKKGLDATGKKDALVEALFAANLREEAIAARRTELKKMALQDLKALASKHGLEASSKEKMVEEIIAYEAKREEEMKLFDTKIDEVVEKKKEVLQKKSQADLKNLCQKNGLATGGGKDEKVERLAEEYRNDGSVEKEVSVIFRATRKDELMKLEKEAIVDLCEKMEIDPYLRDVMIERLITYESEVDEPVTKKARKK